MTEGEEPYSEPPELESVVVICCCPFFLLPLKSNLSFLSAQLFLVFSSDKIITEGDFNIHVASLHLTSF